ncbi:MAG: ASPIC/UnbV domain-containing protein [Flavobacteriales bacterium]|nr:ASPIC/UnbV domain-containing protein [Flavobacteriales bacterium]
MPANVGPVGDLNNDGFLDVQNGNTVYFSQPNGYNWIKLNLKGVQSNINGIGARIELYGAWGKQIRDVQAGIGFRNMGTLNPHFGIGTATSIDSVIVKWPSGNITKICNPPINTNLYVKEDENYSITASFNSSSTNLGTGDTLSLFDSSTNNPTQWQWNISPATGWQFVNGTTSNSQNPQIVFSNPGNYTIQLTVSNDCSSEVSSPTSVNVYSTAGIDDIESDFDVVTYPNPASNLITISINSNLTIKQLKIYNTLGSELFSEICNNSSISIDVSWLNSGYYLIIMDTSTGEKVIQRFIKK